MFKDVFSNSDSEVSSPYLLEEAEETVLVFSKNDGPISKLHYCHLDDMLSEKYGTFRLETGLGDFYTESGASVYVQDNGQIVVNFIAGLFISEDKIVKYSNYKMTGYSIDNLSEAQKTDIYPQVKTLTGCQNPRYNASSGIALHHRMIGFTSEKTIIIEDKQEDKEYFLNLDVDKVVKVSNIYGDSDRIIITAVNSKVPYDYSSYIYNVTENSLMDISTKVTSYNISKCSICNDMIAIEFNENKTTIICMTSPTLIESLVDFERIEK